MRTTRLAALGCALGVAFGLAACGGEAERVSLSGTIRIDGSRTVAPLTKIMAKRFMAANPGVRIAVAASGAGRGFARLCRDETDVVDAFEAIDARAASACERHGVGLREIAVADDAVVVVVSPPNPIRCLTTKQLRQIWHGNSEVTTSWTQVDETRPRYDDKLTAWGPGIDTETFLFFTKAVNGNEGETRDYNNTLHHPRYTILAVAGGSGIIAYVDWSLYRKHADELKALEVDSGGGCVKPTPTTIARGSFRPLARRLLLYASVSAAAQPTEAFLRYYLDNVQAVAPKLGFVAPTDEQLDASRARLDRLVDAQPATMR